MSNHKPTPLPWVIGDLDDEDRLLVVCDNLGAFEYGAVVARVEGTTTEQRLANDRAIIAAARIKDITLTMVKALALSELATDYDQAANKRLIRHALDLLDQIETESTQEAKGAA